MPFCRSASSLAELPRLAAAIRQALSLLQRRDAGAFRPPLFRARVVLAILGDTCFLQVHRLLTWVEQLAALLGGLHCR